MRIELPGVALVVLVGTTGAGKSTFARRHFRPTEVLSSDVFRGLVSDDENDQSATAAAFEALHFVAGKRLAGGRLTVIDATNVQPMARKPLLELARRYQVPPVAILLDTPGAVAAERNRARPDRRFGPEVLARQRAALRRSIPDLGHEGFRHVWTVRPEDADSVVIVRQPRPAEIARRPLPVEIARQPIRASGMYLGGPLDVAGDGESAVEAEPRAASPTASARPAVDET